MTEKQFHKPMPHIEIGHGMARGKPSIELGIEVATSAFEDIKEHPLAVAMVHIKGTDDTADILQGIISVFGDVPIIGATSAEKSDNSDAEVSVITIASPFISVTIAVEPIGQKTLGDAVKRIISSEQFKPYFGEDRDEKWKEIVGIGKSVIGMLLYSGKTVGTDRELERTLGMLRLVCDRRIPFVGGKSIFISGKQAGSLIGGEKTFTDSVMVIILETHLRVGIGTSDGLTPSGITTVITKADQKEVLELDGVSAAERLVMLGHPNAKLGVVDEFKNSKNIITEVNPERGSLIVSTPLPVGTILTVLFEDGNDVLEAGQNAFRKAMIRGNIDKPVFGVFFSSIFRTMELAHTTFNEIASLSQIWPNAEFVGFDTGTELGLTDEGGNRVNKRTISVLILGQNLSYASEVAIENKELVERIRKAEESHRALLDLMPDSVIAADTSMRITYFNPKAQEFLGHKREEVIGIAVDQILQPRLRYELANIVNELIESERAESRTFEEEILRSDKSMIPVEITVSHNPAHDKYRFVISIHDITEHKAIQSLLDKERSAYKTIAEAAIDASSIEELCNRTLKGIIDTLEYDIGSIRLFNLEDSGSHLITSIGMGKEELKQVLHGIVPDPENMALFAPDIRNIQESQGNIPELETLGVHSLVISPLTGSSGNLLGMLTLASFTPKQDTIASRSFFEILAGMFATVIERRMTQAALLESETRVRTVLDSIRDLIFVYDENDNYVEYYSGNSSLLVRPPDGLVGKHIAEVLPPDVASKLIRAFKKVRETKKPVSVDYSLEIQGMTKWFSSSISLHEDGSSIVSVARDITARKVAEQNLAVRMEYEKALADISQLLLMNDDLSSESFKDALAILRFATKADRVYIFENMTDSEKGLCMRLLAEDSAENIPQEGRDYDQYVTPYSAGYSRWERELSRGNVIMGQPKEFPDDEQNRLEMLQIKSLLVFPLWVKSKWHGFIGFDDTTSERVWSENDVRLLRTASEIISTHIGRLAVDAELRSSLRDLELYSSILRHDFANDVNVIMNHIEAGEILGMTEERIKEIIEVTKNCTERMAQVLTGFTVERRQSTYLVSELLKSIVEHGKRTYPNMKIDLQMSAEVERSRVSGGRLLPMVFSNLLRNSNDYAGEDSTVTIEAHTLKDGSIEFIVTDDGPGVSKAIKDHLFQAGTSTSGGGLGLYLSKKVVEGYGGTIEYVENKQRGARFRIVIPTSS